MVLVLETGDWHVINRTPNEFSKQERVSISLIRRGWASIKDDPYWSSRYDFSILLLGMDTYLQESGYFYRFVSCKLLEVRSSIIVFTGVATELVCGEDLPLILAAYSCEHRITRLSKYVVGIPTFSETAY